jgi:hypothetical protein
MMPIKEDARPARGSWAPGNYHCKCCNCGEFFIGDKRAISCADCAYKKEAPPTAETITEARIKHMVDRFLGWKLPESFNPDGGISFTRTHSEQGLFGPQKYEPSGTNILDAAQAEAMVRHMIDGLKL